MESYVHRSKLNVIIFSLIVFSAKGSDSLAVIVNPDSSGYVTEVEMQLNNWKLAAINDGRLNAELNLRSVSMYDSSGKIQIVWEHNYGFEMKVDSVILSGDNDFSPKINKILTTPFMNLPASEETISFVRSSLLKYSFFGGKEKPFFATYGNNQIALLIPTKNVLDSSFSGILGYRPNDRGIGQLTGDISIQFSNLFGYFTLTNINWKRKDQSSQEFSFEEKVPVIPGVNFGGVIGVQQRLQDGMYLMRRSYIGLESYYPKLGTISFGASRGTTSLTDLGLKAGLYPHRKAGLDLRYSIESKDLFKITRNRFFIDSSIQFSELRKENNIKEFLGVGRIEGQLVSPILDDWNLSIRSNLGFSTISGKNSVPLTEQFRFGGASSLRGYQEDIFISKWMVINQFEMRYEIGKKTRIYGFFDTAISDELGYPCAIGFGLNQPTSIGILSIDYGISKDEKPSGGKIHIRIVNSTL